MDSIVGMHDFGLGILLGIVAGVVFDRFLLIPIVVAWTRGIRRRHGGPAR